MVDQDGKSYVLDKNGKPYVRPNPPLASKTAAENEKDWANMRYMLYTDAASVPQPPHGAI